MIRYLAKVFRYIISAYILLLGFYGDSFYAMGKHISQIFPKPLQHDVIVSLKLVQVHVTDRRGNPVPDLRREEFVVYDNGRPVEITEFERHTLPATGGRVEENLGLTSIPSGRLAPLLARKFFLFFDFAYNNVSGIKRAKEAALHFLDHDIVPGDEVGLLSLSLLRGLAVHEYLSTDHKNVRSAVAALDPREAVSGRALEIEQEYWRRMAEGKPPDREGMLGVKSPGELNTDRAEAIRQAGSVVGQIAELARALRSIPGQKHMLFFSTGVPGSMIYGYQSRTGPSVIMANDWKVRGYDFGDPELRKANEDMYKELAASSCSVFSFDTREAAMAVPGASLFAYDNETFASGHRDIFYGQGAGGSPVELFKDDKNAGGYTIGRLSKTTGGQYFSNINEFESNLSKVQELTGNYYVLGYRLAGTADGKFHEVEVKVLRRGCIVRSQSGYFNPKAFRDFTDREKVLHLIELGLTGKSPYEDPAIFSLEPLSYSSRGETRLEILGRLTPDVIEKFREKSVELVLLVFDGNGNLADLRRVEPDLSGYRGMDVYTEAAVVPNPGRYACRFVIRDIETGLAAVSAESVDIGEHPPAGLTAGSPLVLYPEGALVYLDLGGIQKSRAIEPWTDFYPYNRAKWNPVIGSDVRAGSSRLAVVVPCSVAGILAPRIGITVKLIDRASEKEISLPILDSSKTRARDAEVHFLEFSLAGITAGDYDFVVRAQEAGSGLESEAKTMLRIRS